MRVAVVLAIVVLFLATMPTFLSIADTTLTFCLVIGLYVFGVVSVLLPLVQTWYRIEDGMLIYRSGLRWGRIPIDRIWRITRKKASFFTNNASRSYSGLRIQFQQGEVFIGPQEEEDFIADLLHSNPDIVVR